MGSDNSLGTPHKLTKPQIEGLQLGRKEISPRGGGGCLGSLIIDKF